jgi:phosphohistidine phosphatase SixA
VQASPFCRTLETAQLAFGGAAPVENLRHLFPEDERNFRTVGQRTWRLVDQATDKSGNRVLVGHGFNVRPLIGYDPGEGEAVVLRRRADGTVEDLGRITSEDFVQLAQPIASVAPGDVCGSAAVDRQQGVLVCRAVGPAHYWVARQTLPNPQMRDVPDGGPVPVDLLGRLQRGGLTLFMRHARTDWNQAATENPNQRAMYTDTLLAANCDAQRNLTDAGREEVVAAGRALRRLNVRISEVVTSPLCRTRETAGLLDAAAVRADNGLFDTFMFSGHSDTQVNARVLRSLLGTRPPTGHNMLLVGHALNLVQAMGGSLPAEGETLVFEPDGRGGARLVGSVHLSQWIRTN